RRNGRLLHRRARRRQRAGTQLQVPQVQRDHPGRQQELRGLWRVVPRLDE
ncbi:hypothetical protein AURDEDRAFT_178818, partial [Auricularia subglabra TFB-10046 SS5]